MLPPKLWDVSLPLSVVGFFFFFNHFTMNVGDIEDCEKQTDFDLGLWGMEALLIQ